MSSTSRSAAGLADFSRLARWYRALEFIVLGHDLERARFCHLAVLRESKSVLILGEGDGRFVQRLAGIAPSARILCVEGSTGMIRRAEARLTPAQHARVTFACADLRDFTPCDASYDAVVTFFVLDCFTTAEVARMVARISPHLSATARWVYADFALPAGGWRRRRAQLWLAVLYAFFRWLTGLQVRALPETEPALERAGWVETKRRELQHGMLRSSVWRKGTSTTEATKTT